VIEIVDTQENLEKFLEVVEPNIKAGLVTLEKAQIKFYRFEP
jgi:PII-like signaling protein